MPSLAGIWQAGWSFGLVASTYSFFFSSHFRTGSAIWRPLLISTRHIRQFAAMLRPGCQQ